MCWRYLRKFCRSSAPPTSTNTHKNVDLLYYNVSVRLSVLAGLAVSWAVRKLCVPALRCHSKRYRFLLRTSSCICLNCLCCVKSCGKWQVSYEWKEQGRWGRVWVLVKNVFTSPLSRKGGRAKILYPQSKRLNLSCRGTQAWSEPDNMYSRSVVMLPINNTYAA